ncbi:MAG: hydroxyethylthiazole kinase [Clostridiales bacterium]|nr:hydroxyethylthiazole kinase [Clostridiales bacterium]
MSKIDFAGSFARVKEKEPLVQCITNFVTVNDCANIILAAGGSPSMARDIREAAEAVGDADALVCNLGAIDLVDSMVSAGKRANELGLPVILDPVGVGGTELRREAGRRLLDEVTFCVIRGNASEIRYLAEHKEPSRSGVDVNILDMVSRQNLPEAAGMVKRLAAHTGSVIALSGELDVISDGNTTVVLENGCPMMSRITGSGCMLTSLIGAFCGACPDDILSAACTAAAVMGISGELAEKQRLRKGSGNATFRTDLIDAVFCMTPEKLLEEIHYEIFERRDS